MDLRVEATAIDDAGIAELEQVDVQPARSRLDSQVEAVAMEGPRHRKGWKFGEFCSAGGIFVMFSFRITTASAVCHHAASCSVPCFSVSRYSE